LYYSGSIKKGIEQREKRIPSEGEKTREEGNVGTKQKGKETVSFSF